MSHATGDLRPGAAQNAAAVYDRSTSAITLRSHEQVGPVREPATDEITITLDGHRIGTGQTKFGAVIGDEVGLPAATVLCPGTLIGPGTVIYPHTHIGGVLPAGSSVR